MLISQVLVQECVNVSQASVEHPLDMSMLCCGNQAVDMGRAGILEKSYGLIYCELQSGTLHRLCDEWENFIKLNQVKLNF